MVEKPGTDDQTWKCNTVRDLFQHRPRASKRRCSNPFSTVVVNDHRERKVNRCNDNANWVGSLLVVLRPLHLGNDQEIIRPAALETKIVAEATIPAIKFGWPITSKPKSNGPVCGAAAGRSLKETPITTTSTPEMTETKATVRGKVIFPHVRIEENMVVRIKPTKLNQTVQTPWFENAFNAVEIPMMPLPLQRT